MLRSLITTPTNSITHLLKPTHCSLLLRHSSKTLTVLFTEKVENYAAKGLHFFLYLRSFFTFLVFLSFSYFFCSNFFFFFYSLLIQKIGEEKEVKIGFARRVLFPRKIAVVASKEAREDYAEFAQVFLLSTYLLPNINAEN